jgi:putative ABC transport system permease protein
MTTLLQDVRYAFRVLVKKPAFTAVAILTLALGIGANTAIFSVVDSVLLRPLPFPQPGRIFQILKQYKTETGDSISVPLFNYWSQHNHVFAQFAAFSNLPIGFNLAEHGLPERVPGVRVTEGFFKVMGIEPALGRDFLPEEDRPGGERVVIISHNLWHIRFHDDPHVSGKAINVNGQPYTVVGVMPEGFRFPSAFEFGSGTDLWMPFQPPPGSRDPANYLAALGRLKPGATREQASAELSALTQQLRKDILNIADTHEGATLVPLQERVVGRVRPVLMILLAAVCLVLLIACVNVANLLLARSAERAKEIAIRSAMGAGRWRVIRQLMVESILLGLLGGLAGLGVALLGSRTLVALTPLEIPAVSKAGLDLRMLSYALGVSLLTGLLFGLAPAVSISRTNLNETLKEGSSRATAGGHRRKLSGALVSCEIALSLILLTGAGLMLQSFVRLAHVEPGFDPHHVLTFETTLPEAKYGTPAPLNQFYRDVLGRLQALPGVESAAIVTNLPTELGPDLPYVIEGRTPSSPGGDTGDSQYRLISADYFRAMRIPLVQGRTFTDADTQTSQGVVIINQTMAHLFWPHENPVGQTIIIGKPMGPDWTDRPRQIVGLVGDVKDDALNQPPPPEMFIPYLQTPARVAALMVRLIPTCWVIRTKGDPYSLSSAAGRAVLSVDASEPVARVKSMEEVLSSSIARWKFSMFLLGAFAVLALVLAAVGIYGVLSYSASQRTHEMGIRMALGAERDDVVKLVVGEGLVLALAGMGIGIFGPLLLTRFLSSQLYGVKPTDPATFAVVSLALIAVAFLACSIPAWRAARVDPMAALHYE